MSVEKTLALAARQIGYYAPEDPEPGSRAGRWLAERLGQPWLRGPSWSIWWCMCFASWMVYEGGGTLPGGPTFNTDSLLRAARREGWGIVPVHTARPGDLVIYDWGDDGPTDHVGIIERTYSWGIQTIEGNTSPGDAGSQSAGNGTYRRTRKWATVDYIVRPRYSGHSTGGRAAPGVWQVEEDGVFGPRSIALAQAIYHTPVDGEIWHQDADNADAYPALAYDGGGVRYGPADGGSALIRALQTTLKRGGYDPGPSDGILGTRTITALQRALGVSADGVLGPVTALAWQAWLNGQARRRNLKPR